MISINELYAKPDTLLIDHMMDVGYISESLMRYGRAKSAIKSISKRICIPIPKLIRSISFLCACHDIGKAHPFFINKMYKDELPDLFDSLLNRNYTVAQDCSEFRHERYSRDIMRKWFVEKEYDLATERFATLLAFHHQGKEEDGFADRIKIDTLPEDWKEVQYQIIDKLASIWKFDPIFAISNQYMNGVDYTILSIMVTSDWIASGSQWKDLLANKKGTKKQLAKKFILENELAYYPIKDRFKDIKWDNAFDFDKNDLQKKVIKASKSKPSFMIVEYPCGGGKTEAAIAAATIMGKNKSGIYLACPTMATAKSMTLRMADSVKRAGLDFTVPEYDSSVIWSDLDMLSVPSHLWTSRNRHKMLYPFAVGTVDQIIKTILYYKYACISLIGLSDKVLIIDEVHAYDCYMLTELKALIKWCRFLDIPVILLSATLPTLTKEQLLVAAGCSKNALVNKDAYPLITTYSKEKGLNFIEVPCDGRVFNLNIVETPELDKEWEHQLSLKYDGCTAFIKGTVDDTWELFDYAKKKRLRTLMFHSRDSVVHKENKTLKLLKLLGKDKSHRPKRLAVTATSIIEQSLDIDFDRMVTSVAPIDLLIQRFGRVWRHSDEGTIREHGTVVNPLTIIIPTQQNKFLTNLYNKVILYKTVYALKGITQLDTVKDARRLIDTVYSTRDLLDIPSEIVVAGFSSLNNPEGQYMIDNDAIKYAKFSQNSAATRYETYPTTSIALVNDNDLVDLTTNYETTKRVMREKVVDVASYKLQKLPEPMKFGDGLLSCVNFYKEDVLSSLGIILTQDGLRWGK